MKTECKITKSQKEFIEKIMDYEWYVIAKTINGTEKINPLHFNLVSQKINYWVYRNIYLPQLSNAVLVLNKE